MTLLVSKKLRNKYLTPIGLTSHTGEEYETVRGKKLKFYIRGNISSPVNFSKILLESIQQLRKYKCANLAFQGINQ